MEPKDKPVSTKYIVLHSIFKAAWDNEADAKERFMAWFHEDKKKRATLERENREYKKRLEESIEDCKKALDQRDSSQEEVKRLALMNEKVLKDRDSDKSIILQYRADQFDKETKILELESRVKELTELVKEAYATGIKAEIYPFTKEFDLEIWAKSKGINL